MANNYLIIVLVLVFSTIASLFFATTEAVTENPRYFRQILTYILISIIFSSILLGCLFYIWSKQSAFEFLYICIIVAAISLFLGFLYVWTFETNLKWVDQLNLSNKIWFTLALFLLGQLLILVISRIFYNTLTTLDSSVPFKLWMGGMFFPIPFFVRESFKAWNQIPEPIFKVWTIPNAVPDVRKYARDKVSGRPFITIMQNGNIFSKEEPNLPLKAPFGEIFHAFIKQLNDDRIKLGKQSLRFKNPMCAGSEWRFYIIEANTFKSFLFGKNIYLDPELTCERLNIQGKKIIAELLN